MRLSVTFVLCFLLLPLATAQTPAVSPANQDRFVGVWVWNEDKTDALNVHSGVRVRVQYSVLTITREGDFLALSIKRGPIPQVSAEQHNVSEQYRTEVQWAYKCDGEAHPTPYGSVSCRYD